MLYFGALKELYVNDTFRDEILAIIQSHLPKKLNTGRRGLSLLQVFVFAQLRLCLDISYDRLDHMTNHDELLRHILGIRGLANVEKIQWNYQRIYDNVAILSDAAVQDLNGIIVKMGHQALFCVSKILIMLWHNSVLAALSNNQIIYSIMTISLCIVPQLENVVLTDRLTLMRHST